MVSKENTEISEIPIRIQRSRQHKQVSPNSLPIVYVGRGSSWGNPFRIIKYSDGKYAIKTDGSEICSKILVRHCHADYNTKDEATIDAIECYNYWLLQRYNAYRDFDFLKSIYELEEDLLNLKGKNLSCWCNINKKCHADLLIKLANK